MHNFKIIVFKYSEQGALTNEILTTVYKDTVEQCLSYIEEMEKVRQEESGMKAFECRLYGGVYKLLDKTELKEMFTA